MNLGPPETKVEDAWTVLEQFAGTIDAPTDWSEEHDHYIHGTPRAPLPEEEEA